MRALNIHRAAPAPPPSEGDALRRWTARRREMLLEDRLDKLVTVLERLVVVLERRAS